MYLQNKYTNWYFSIISKARSRLLFSEYTESHHIIPKSLGGSNDVSNLINLTAKEHFICHLLLTKMVDGESKRKMIYACWAMSNQKRPDQHRHQVSSNLYKIIREQAVNNHKLFNHTEETKKVISSIHKGKILSKETKDKISKSRKGIKISLAHKEKLKNGHKDFRHTEEHKDKMSKLMKHLVNKI